MALASTDPRVLMGQAKCFSCLSPKLQYQLRTYLLAKLAMGDTSITGVQALSVASTCFSCFTHGELLAAKQYLMAVWLGLDTTKTGIIAQAATAACDYSCLTPVQAEQVRTYLLAVAAGVATDAAGVRALELAAKCFECPTNKRQLEMQVYLLSTLAPGAPTTPAAIMQAAGCFLACVPPETRAALQTSLFAQVANRSTPPCVTPSAPNSVQVAAAHVADPNTQLLVRWLQPANSGTIITGYTVFWGTSAGGPYPNSSGLLGAGSKLYTITGLTAGTTYYVVVQADTSISGCVSANSAEANGTTSGSSTCAAGVTFANAWALRVVANGGAAPSALTINAIAAFQCGLISDGLDTQMLSWNAFVPDSLTAALTPQLLGAGIDPWQNPFPIPAGNLSVNGLTGVAGSASLGTNLTPANTFSSIGSAGMCVYAYTASATGIDVGVISGTNRYELASKFSDNNAYDWNGLGTSQITLASPGNGWYSSQRISNTDHKFYFATSISPHAQIGATDAGDITGMVLSNVNGFVVFAVNNGGVIAGWSGDTLSFVGWTKGLTAAQDTALFARVQTLRTALGGGFR